MKDYTIPEESIFKLWVEKTLPDSKLQFKKWKKKPPKKLDEVVSEIHDEVFDSLDCLKCANCCKTISPVITYRDVEKMASGLRIKPSELVERYLRIDEDNDFVFRQTPCPFLEADNYCRIYENRPKACREYPHTNRQRFYQILDLTIRNIQVCPATYYVVENLKARLK